MSFTSIHSILLLNSFTVVSLTTLYNLFLFILLKVFQLFQNKITLTDITLLQQHIFCRIRILWLNRFTATICWSSSTSRSLPFESFCFKIQLLWVQPAKALSYSQFCIPLSTSTSMEGIRRVICWSVSLSFDIFFLLTLVYLIICKSGLHPLDLLD